MTSNAVFIGLQAAQSRIARWHGGHSTCYITAILEINKTIFVCISQFSNNECASYYQQICVGMGTAFALAIVGLYFLRWPYIFMATMLLSQ